MLVLPARSWPDPPGMKQKHVKLGFAQGSGLQHGSPQTLLDMVDHGQFSRVALQSAVTIGQGTGEKIGQLHQFRFVRVNVLDGCGRSSRW